VDERERNVVKRRIVVKRSIKEVHFPRVKTLEEFDFETASHIPSARLRKLAEGKYVGRTEPVIFLLHQNRGPFLWAVLLNPAHRRELLQQGWNNVGKVYLIATILDVVYCNQQFQDVDSPKNDELVGNRSLRSSSRPAQSHRESGIRRKTFSETPLDPISSVTLGLVTVFDYIA